MSLGLDVNSDRSVAVVYLARGADEGYNEHFQKFINSYLANESGESHQLYIIFKGFVDNEAQCESLSIFSDLDFVSIHTKDDSYDIGAYRDALKHIGEDIVCFLNTYSEVATYYWLNKIVNNLKAPGVGMVGATGSYESLHNINRHFPKFPNPHIRTNAFAMERRFALELLESYNIDTKLDTFKIESGEDGLTQKVFRAGMSCLVIGADGRGYNLNQWAASKTYRSGNQGNLVVKDNYTREFDRSTARERQILSTATWGWYPKLVESVA